MPSYAWLIAWLPLLGFIHNASAGFLYRDLDTRKKAVSYVAPGVVLLAFAVTLYVLVTEMLPSPDHRLVVPLIPGLSPETPWISVAGFKANFGILLDPLSMLMAMIVTGIGGLIHIYATGYMADDREQPRFFTYFNLFIFMMLLLVLGSNFLMLFVGWEGVGTCSYLLISFWYTDTDNAKAGNKAFIVNRIGDLGFALGMMAIWSVFGTLTFYAGDKSGVMQLAARHVDVLGRPLVPQMITLICCLLFVGAVGKSAQIPLWVWLPDAMAGPTPVSALIHAATMVTAGVVMVTRCSWLFVQAPAALQLMGWIGLATAFVGATIGLVQNDIKRVLAFSTVSQLGYMFLACGVGNFTAGMFHVLTHACFKALLFLGSGAVIHSMLGEQDMRKMGGLKKLIPKTWMLMFVGTYAIAGFPGGSGFFSKDEILGSASASPWGNGMVLYAVGLFTAFMTAFYMNRLMHKTFYTDARFVDGELAAHHHSNFEDEEHAGEHTDEHNNVALAAHSHSHSDAKGTGRVHESPPSMMFPLYVLAILSVVIGFILGPTKIFERFLEPSVAHLDIGPLAEGSPLVSEVTGWVISATVAILGLLVAWAMYGKAKNTGELMTEQAKARNPVYLFLMDKWCFDRAYNYVFITLGGRFADRFLWKKVDVGLIDGAVNYIAQFVGELSTAFRKVQTGYVRNYALGILCGVVALVAGLLAQWSSIHLR
jgi:NADH-quinone oxidoreductase subunit L